MELPLTVADHLHRAVTVFGDRVGIVDEPSPPGGGLGELTYREVARYAAAQAAGLEAIGVGRGERVAIVSQNAARLLISILAVPGSGRVLVPINFRLRRDEIAYIVEHSGSTVLLHDDEMSDVVAGLPVQRMISLGSATDAELYDLGAEPEPWSDPDENATATINYTSGTTARPKGVELTHRNLWLNAAVFGWQTGVNEADVYLHTLPMFHCNGWGMPFAAAAMGVPQIVLRKTDGAEILRRIDRHGVTLLCGAPTVVSLVLDAAAEWDGSIPGAGRTRIVVAGAPPPTRVVERVATDLGWEFIQLYGLTETSPLLTLNRSRSEWAGWSDGERAAALVKAGPPALGVQVRIDDSGEVLARSNVVMKGYWNQPRDSAEAMREGWFHTGDLGSIDDDSYLTISDRLKDVIITGGENVSSAEVEDALADHPAVAESCVIGVPDDKWGETVKALVVVRPGVAVTAEEIIAFAKSKLAGYKCPTSVEIRESLERTATGKLKKAAIRAPFWEGRTRPIA